jgi:hypothetical protein
VIPSTGFDPYLYCRPIGLVGEEGYSPELLEVPRRIESRCAGAVPGLPRSRKVHHLGGDHRQLIGGLLVNACPIRFEKRRRGVQCGAEQSRPRPQRVSNHPKRQESRPARLPAIGGYDAAEGCDRRDRVVRRGHACPESIAWWPGKSRERL